LSVLTAKALGYNKNDIKNIGLGAFLHDIGKMLVDPDLISKTSSLTEEEKQAVEKHPELGYNLIKNIDSLPYTAKQIVLLHHEKLDGKGYPYGLKGIEIPEFVRIVTLCDMYDAMTTDRVYRKKMPIYIALEILMRDAVYKLDRNIYRHMTENICIFPPGSGVVLSDGRIGIVSFYRATNPSRPHVRVLDLETDITDIKVDNVNLEKKRTLFISDTWDVHEFKKGIQSKRASIKN
jgi:HD-GYP domain-containing protein (c-di-GMP phosphodiesterase class II)